MSKVAVLKAFGPNYVEVIPMVFESLAAGEIFMNEKLAQFEGQTGEWFDGYENRKPKYKEAPLFQKRRSKNKITYLLHDSIEEDYDFMRQFFTRYDNSNGGVYRFELQEIEFGKKLCGFTS
jgi:hypothetical protein